MNNNQISRPLSKIVLGLGGVPSSSRKISGRVRIGIRRVEFANGFYLLGPILALYLVISDFWYRPTLIYVLLLIGAILYWINVKTSKKAGKKAIRYHYRNRRYEKDGQSFRLIGWTYFVGSGVACWLLIMGVVLVLLSFKE